MLDNLHSLLTPSKEALPLYLFLWAQTYMGIFLNFQKGLNIYCKNGEIWYTGVNIICFFIREHPLFQRKMGIVHLGNALLLFWVHGVSMRWYPKIQERLSLKSNLLLMAVSSGVDIWSKLLNSERTSDLTYPFDMDLKKIRGKNTAAILWSNGTINEINMPYREQQRES